MTAPTPPRPALRPWRRERGLTMVEAMSMLLALGLVAALALPKMAEQQSRARLSKLRATAQALQLTATAVRDLAVTRFDDCREPTPHSLQMHGEAIALRHCQPAPLADFDQGLLAAARLSPADGWRLPPQGLPDRVVVELADAAQPARCQIHYIGSGPEQPAEVATLTDGC